MLLQLQPNVSHVSTFFNIKGRYDVTELFRVTNFSSLLIIYDAINSSNILLFKNENAHFKNTATYMKN